MTIDSDCLADPVVPVVEMPQEEVPVKLCSMTLGDHLDELRKRLILCLLPFLPLFVLGLVFYRELWNFLLTPFFRASQLLGLAPDAIATFQRPGLIEGFLVSAHIACYASALLTAPWIVWQGWQFVSPGLEDRERILARRVFLSGAMLFAAGVAVAFCYAIPLGLEFLYQFNQGLAHTVDLPTMDWYLGFLVMCCVGFGIGFETPLVMMGLAWAGLITPKGILRYWRHAMLAIIILGAVFTPPDPFTQLFLASLMGAFYWAGYLLAWWVAPKQPLA